jgi:hypothetical protein
MDNESDDEKQDNTYEKNNRKQANTSKITVDNALEIIEMEFKEVEDWTKKEMKRLKYDCFDIIDSLKMKYQ